MQGLSWRAGFVSGDYGPSCGQAKRETAQGPTETELKQAIVGGSERVESPLCRRMRSKMASSANLSGCPRIFECFLAFLWQNFLQFAILSVMCWYLHLRTYSLYIYMYNCMILYLYLVYFSFVDACAYTQVKIQIIHIAIYKAHSPCTHMHYLHLE